MRQGGEKILGQILMDLKPEHLDYDAGEDQTQSPEMPERTQVSVQPTDLRRPDLGMKSVASNLVEAPRRAGHYTYNKQRPAESGNEA